jgi:glycosyltransferase involved in cell wall biosynthesis
VSTMDPRKPIVLFSDHPAAQSGLARITRDLALRIHRHLGEEFKVATLGHGSPGSAQLPFQQYQWKENDWFIPTELPFIATDFCENQPFILFTIGDIQRFLPLADPQFCQDRPFAGWWQAQRAAGTKLWGYFPIDAHGRDGKLPAQLAHTLTYYDRVLVPSEWAAEIVRNTIPGIEVTAIPHGIDTDIFKPIENAREKIGEVMDPVLQWPKEQIDVGDSALWIGICATSQWRKDWGAGIATVAEIAKKRPVFLWCHTNRLKTEHWSLLELLSEFGLLQSSMVTVGGVSDADMAVAYSAMDCTISIDRGAGFNYPAFESIFCATPCFAADYGAHVEFMDIEHICPSAIMRTEGSLSLLRPIFLPEHWKVNIESGLNSQMRYPEELKWSSVWPRFAQWFRESL